MALLNHHKTIMQSTQQEQMNGTQKNLGSPLPRSCHSTMDASGLEDVKWPDLSLLLPQWCSLPLRTKFHQAKASCPWTDHPQSITISWTEPQGCTHCAMYSSKRHNTTSLYARHCIITRKKKKKRSRQVQVRLQQEANVCENGTCILHLEPFNVRTLLRTFN